MLQAHFQRSTMLNCILAVDSVEKFLKFHRDFMEIHLVLLDVMLYTQSSIRSIPQIKKRVKDAEVVMFTFMDDADTVFQALRNGATGYLIKEDKPEEIERKILFTLQGGGALLSPAIARKVIEYFNPGKSSGFAFLREKLNDKERLVMQMLQEGHLCFCCFLLELNMENRKLRMKLLVLVLGERMCSSD